MATDTANVQPDIGSDSVTLEETSSLPLSLPNSKEFIPLLRENWASIEEDDCVDDTYYTDSGTSTGDSGVGPADNKSPPLSRPSANLTKLTATSGKFTPRPTSLLTSAAPTKKLNKLSTSSLEGSCDEKTLDGSGDAFPVLEDSITSDTDTNLSRDLPEGGVSEALASSGVTAPAGGSSGGMTEHYVMVHINAGETFSVRVGDQIQHIPGPATVRMVSNSGPPLPMPMQVPPGHLVQQIVDENGILTHVILSPYPGPAMGPPPPPHLSPLMNCGPPHQGPMHNSQPPLYGSPNGSMNMNHGYQYGPYHHSNYGQYPGFMSGGGGHSHSSSHHGGMDDRHGMDRNPKGRSSGRGNKRHHNVKDSYNQHFPHFHHQQGPFTGRRRRGKVNGSLRRSDIYNSTSSSGEENAFEDEEKRAIKEILSAMPTAQISEVEARTALIQLFLPEIPAPSSNSTPSTPNLNSEDITFELLLSENGPEGRYNLVFSSKDTDEPSLYGGATKICLQDLKPASDYFVKACAVYDGVRGDLSSPVVLSTQQCEPAAPKPPQLTNKNRNSLSIRWTTPPDHGAKITAFILEWINPEAEPREFTELYTGSLRHYKAQKLQPATEYAFRLAAINSHGQSDWSEISTFCTTGTAPSQPDPPQLQTAMMDSLALRWVKRPGCDSFTLQMEDTSTGNAFIPVYKGPETGHTVTNLRRCTRYKFRLAAQNEEGTSKWSQVIFHETLASCPSSPSNLKTKGRIDPTSFTVTWLAPQDDGGSPVSQYKVELCTFSGASAPPPTSDLWREVHQCTGSGPLEFLCTGLQAGSKVLVRVRCQSTGNSLWGEPCDPLTVALGAVLPDQCAPPRLSSRLAKAGSTSLRLSWQHPLRDGGAKITLYEVSQTSMTPLPPPSASTTTPTSGKSSKKSSTSRSNPGTPRNSNPSSPFKQSAQKTSTPSSLQTSPSKVPLTPGGSVAMTTVDEVVYSGSGLECTVADLTPERTYEYRVRAHNSLGPGPWSQPLSVESGPALPSVPGNLSAQVKSCHSVVLSWSAPSPTKPQKLEYRVECRSKPDPAPYMQLYSGEALQFEAKTLSPATHYWFRVLGVNSAGTGPPTDPPIELTTPPGSPGQITGLKASPPQKTSTSGCGSSSSLVISWRIPADNGSPITGYLLDVDGHVMQLNAVSLAVAGGERVEYRLEGLLPEYQYKIRMQAVNEVGDGSASASLKVTTPSLPPLAPRLECIQIQSSSLKLKWVFDQAKGSAVTDNLLYTLEMSRQQDSDVSWQVVYTGVSHTHKITRLMETTEYFFRISASNDAGVGEYSSILSLTTSKAAPPAVRPPKIYELTTESCRVEWPAVRPIGQDEISYVLQLMMVNSRDTDYRQVYRGSETLCRLNALIPGTDYLLRVCALRAGQDSDITGPFSQALAFTTRGGGVDLDGYRMVSSTGDSTRSRHYGGSSSSGSSTTADVLRTFTRRLAWPGPLSDSVCAGLIVVLFIFACLVLAYVCQSFVATDRTNPPMAKPPRNKEYIAL